MLDIKQIKKEVLKVQESEIRTILDEIEYIFNSTHLSDIERLNELLSFNEELLFLNDNLISEEDIKEYIDDDFIMASYWKARHSAENDNISEHELDIYIMGFLVGYLSEHIRISKRLKELD